MRDSNIDNSPEMRKFVRSIPGVFSDLVFGPKDFEDEYTQPPEGDHGCSSSVYLNLTPGWVGRLPDGVELPVTVQFENVEINLGPRPPIESKPVNIQI